MANEKNKQKLNIWLEKILVEQIDDVCKRDDISRATVIKNALKIYFDDKQRAATKTDIEMLKAKIETLDANQTTRNTLLLDAIQNQPIAVQERLVLEEPTAESQKQQGFFSRLFGK